MGKRERECKKLRHDQNLGFIYQIWVSEQEKLFNEQVSEKRLGRGFQFCFFNVCCFTSNYITGIHIKKISDISCHKQVIIIESTVQNLTFETKAELFRVFWHTVSISTTSNFSVLRLTGKHTSFYNWYLPLTADWHLNLRSSKPSARSSHILQSFN